VNVTSIEAGPIALPIPLSSAGSLAGAATDSGGAASVFASLLESLSQRIESPGPNNVPHTAPVSQPEGRAIRKAPDPQRKLAPAPEQATATALSTSMIVAADGAFLQIANDGGQKQDGPRLGPPTSNAGASETVPSKATGNTADSGEVAFALRLTPVTEQAGSFAAALDAAESTKTPMPVPGVTVPEIEKPQAPAQPLNTTDNSRKMSNDKPSEEALGLPTARSAVSPKVEQSRPRAVEGIKAVDTTDSKPKEDPKHSPVEKPVGAVQGAEHSAETVAKFVEAVAQPADSSFAAGERHAPKVSPAPEINPMVPPQPTRQISLKLTGADASKVDIQVTDRAGKVQVSVRTPDHELAKSMQADLGELVGRLEGKGFKTETWVPSTVHSLGAVRAEQSGSAGGQNEQWSGQSGGEWNQGQSGDSNPQHNPRGARQFEDTLSAEEEKGS